MDDCRGPDQKLVKSITSAKKQWRQCKCFKSITKCNEKMDARIIKTFAARLHLSLEQGKPS